MRQTSSVQLLITTIRRFPQRRITPSISQCDTGIPTRVDAFFLKSKGVASHIGTPTGGTGTGWTHRTLPSTVNNIRGESVSTTFDGFQHDLYLLPTHFTATSVRLQFTGTNVEIYEMMLLEVIQEIDANSTPSDFVEFQAEQADRAARVERSPIGSLSVISGEGDREKRDVNMTVYTYTLVATRLLTLQTSSCIFWKPTHGL